MGNQLTSPCGKSTEVDVDVVVVGGGLSGLVSATELQAKGVSCVVLEARDRVGGKLWSKPYPTGSESALEAGAGWLNANTQPMIYRLTQKFDLDTIVQYRKGKDVVVDRAGHIKTPDASIPPGGDDLEQIMMIISGAAAAVDIYDIEKGNANFQDMALSDWLVQNGLQEHIDAWDTIRLLVICLFGLEPREVSALYFLDYIKSGLGLESLSGDGAHGAQNRRLRQGNQTVALRLADTLHQGTVHLSCPVETIYQRPAPHNDILVTAGGGRVFRCRRVIVSVPTPLYRTISFQPPLPERKASYANATTLGDYAKVTLVYRTPWWRDHGLSGGFENFSGPVVLSRDTSSEVDKLYSLTCFVVGDDCRSWAKGTPAERKKAVVDQIARMASEGGGVSKEKSPAYDVVHTCETIWMTEPWSLGGPVPCPGPGKWGPLGDALREPFDHVHFVGTETAFLWKGYMEGAVTAGQRGAWEVVAALKGKGQ